MSQIFNSKVFSWLSILFVSLGLTKLLWSLLLFILPVEPPFIESSNISTFGYGSISLGDKFVAEEEGQISKISTNLKNITLKAIYKKPKAGFAVLEEQGKQVYLDLKKSYQGYKLIEIHKTHIILKKDEELYKVVLAGYKPKEGGK